MAEAEEEKKWTAWRVIKILGGLTLLGGMSIFWVRLAQRVKKEVTEELP